MAGKLITPEYWDEAKAHLSKRDKTLKAIIKAYDGETLQLKGEPFFTLTRSIVGQQISVKAADSVYARFAEAVGTVTPENVANCPAEVLRASGLSASKVIYMHALAMHFLDHHIGGKPPRMRSPSAKAASRPLGGGLEYWAGKSDAEIIKELTGIKGIGVWTAEMFLLFALGRPDVFPVLDLGLLKGIYRHYNKGEKMSKAEVLAIGERWRPYRSMGTWYMWRALDPVPVAY